jgi:hypothetical protein
MNTYTPFYHNAIMDDYGHPIWSHFGFQSRAVMARFRLVMLSIYEEH